MRRLALLAALAIAFAGCANKHDYTTVAETEGIYVDVGDLVYQVQLSRFLNPADIEDEAYLAGLPGTTAPLTGEEIWFGVWMRVKNYTEETLTPATDFTIVDTEETEFSPVEQDTASNPFVYDAQPIPPAGVLPRPSSAAADGPIQGSLLLYRLTTDSLQNRPLELRIEQGEGQEATVDLDL